MRIVLAISMLLLALAAQRISPAEAQSHTVPRFDTAGFCRENARQMTETLKDDLGSTPEGRAAIVRSCVEREEKLEAELARLWERLPQAEIAERCHRHTTTKGMLQCVEGWKEQKAGAEARLAILSKLKPAHAALPRWDIDRTCRARAADGKDPKADYLECMKRQQASYDFLKPVWGRLPHDIASLCTEIQKGPYKSYWLVETCVNVELDKALKVHASAERERAIPSTPFRY